MAGFNPNSVTPYELWSGDSDNGIVWEDMRFPLTRDKQGQSQKPDFDFVNIGLLFPEGIDSEIVYIIGQFSHTIKPNSNIRPHIHWMQSQEATPTFKIDYRLYINGGHAPTTWTTLSTNGGVYDYVSGDLIQISSFGEIDGNGLVFPSSMIEVKLYRDDSDVSGDILAKEFDIHFQVNSAGTDQEYSNTR